MMQYMYLLQVYFSFQESVKARSFGVTMGNAYRNTSGVMAHPIAPDRRTNSIAVRKSKRPD